MLTKKDIEDYKEVSEPFKEGAKSEPKGSSRETVWLTSWHTQVLTEYETKPSNP